MTVDVCVQDLVLVHCMKTFAGFIQVPEDLILRDEVTITSVISQLQHSESTGVERVLSQANSDSDNLARGLIPLYVRLQDAFLNAPEYHWIYVKIDK